MLSCAVVLVLRLLVPRFRAYPSNLVLHLLVLYGLYGFGYVIGGRSVVCERWPIIRSPFSNKRCVAQGNIFSHSFAVYPPYLPMYPHTLVRSFKYSSVTIFYVASILFWAQLAATAMWGVYLSKQMQTPLLM